MLRITFPTVSLLGQLAATLLALVISGCGGGNSGSTNVPGGASTTPASVSSSLSSSSNIPGSSSVFSSASSSALSTTLVVPSGGVPLVDADLSKPVQGFVGTPAIGSYSVVSTEGPTFDKSLRIYVEHPTGNFWEAQVIFPVIKNVAKGDVLLAHLWFRKISSMDETGSGFITLFLESNGPSYTKYVSRDLSSTGDWQEYFIPLQMSEAATVGNVSLKFGFAAGSKQQVIELGGIELLNYGADKKLADMPVTLPTYGGREPNATWRAEANARIEKIRKDDFTVTVLDKSGQPVSGANVDIRFRKHDYQFGSVIQANLLMGTSSDSVIYREKVLNLFNESGTENDLKWAPWIGEWGSDFNKTQTLDALKFLRDKGFYLRGHVMVWPSKRNSPDFIASYFNSDPVDPIVKQKILEHIDDVGSATANLVDEWDVLNEPYDNHDYMDQFGQSLMVDWFQRARMNLPTQKLYINDYSILSAGGRDFAHQNFYTNTIQYLIDQGAPINGIGMQSHFSDTPTDIPTIYSILDKFHNQFPNLAIRSTEFDINTTDENLQADFTRDFLTIFFSHPGTVGVQMWGFWAKAHWIPTAALYDQNWREKPNAAAWKNLTQKVWWNDFTGVTTSEGTFKNRGFYGIYDVDVKLNGNTERFQIHVEKGTSNNFTLTLAQ